MPILLFRKNRDTADDFAAAQKHFDVTESRIIRDQLVVGRFSVLPHYQEVERDLHLQGSKLINSFYEHEYISSFEWYWDVEAYTPKTWFDFRSVPSDQGPYVVKGRTNSKKFQWNKKMFAETYEDLKRVQLALYDDDLLVEQGLVFRKYVPLKTYEIGINGLPFSNEWRFFYFRDKLLSFGYYWVISENHQGEIDANGQAFAQKIASILCERTNFFVLDIAQTVAGEWILIEVNDGQMSGLSGNDPDVMYANLKKELSSV